MVDDDLDDGAHSFNGYDLASFMKEPKSFALTMYEFSDNGNSKCFLRLDKKTGDPSGLRLSLRGRQVLRLDWLAFASEISSESEADESEKGEWENDEVRKKVRKAVTRWVPKSKVEKGGINQGWLG
ncbi:hypothetical protein SCAR479_13720 [Seiridium cardinale]|uniref:Uncharacterized protein n=1 Tax=Seiridium cardinale TaxID=138064 RepID=A0ABR2X7J8_9PEZI